MAHQKGAAHEWTIAEAREAGRKGGSARHGHSPMAAPDHLGSERPERFDQINEV
jgi:hypothetical protein